MRYIFFFYYVTFDVGNRTLDEKKNEPIIILIGAGRF